MKPKHASKRDPNEDAHDVVRRSTERPDAIPASVEAAWVDWSKRIQGVDQRTLNLLRAAFEAGADAGRRTLALLGAKKGGAARAAKLSDRRRRAIARKAAEARWGPR